MNKNIGMIIGVIVLTVIFGGIIYTSNNAKDDAIMAKEQMEQKAMEEKRVAEEQAMMEKKAMEEKEVMMAKYTGTVLAGKSALLLDYNKADYDMAIASDKLVVLYFYANWCPICKEEN